MNFDPSKKQRGEVWLICTLYFCPSQRMSISLKQLSQESGLLLRMAFRSSWRSLRETPSSCHLLARPTTADITSRRSSSSAGMIIWKSKAAGNLIDWDSFTDYTAHLTAITSVSSFITNYLDEVIVVTTLSVTSWTPGPQL